MEGQRARYELHGRRSFRTLRQNYDFADVGCKKALAANSAQLAHQRGVCQWPSQKGVQRYQGPNHGRQLQWPLSLSFKDKPIFKTKPRP